MENVLGILRIRVHRGVNLAIRDAHKRSSDPYVVITLGRQKLKTKVVENNVNPEWNDDLTLCVEDPNTPVKLEVFDYDKLTFDDKMGETEFSIKPFIDSAKMNLEDLSDGVIIERVTPSRENCLVEESKIMYKDKKVVQDMVLRLKNAESGEVEIQLQWIKLPGLKQCA